MEKELQNKRDCELSTITKIKSMMMLLVVIYHCTALWMQAGWFNQAPERPNVVLGGLAEWMNYIHIYAFTFASGYLFHYSYVEKQNVKNWLPVIHKRFSRLIVPYIFITLIWLIPFEIVFFHPTLRDIVVKFALGTGPRQLWFLLMLFNVNLLFIALKKIFEKIKIRFSFRNGMVALYVVGIVASLLSRLGIPNIFQILTAFRYLLYFYFGYHVSKSGTATLDKIPMHASLFFNAGLFACVYVMNHYLTGIWRNAVILLVPILCLTSIVLSYKIACAVSVKWNEKIYGELTKNEFGIYLFHQQIIWIVINLLNRKFVAPLLIVVAALTISVIGSICITKICRNVKPMQNLLHL